MPVDFMAVLQAGQGLVPDLREQLWQDRQRKEVLQAKQVETQNLQAAQVRKQRFQADIAAAVQSGDPRAIGQMMVKYPEFADQVKPGWQALSEDARRANLTQTGMVYERARNGDTKGAAALLRKRYEADVAAGQGDETTKEILDALEGDDPQAQKVAVGSLGFLIAADDPSKFAETYGKLNPTDAIDPLEKKYNFILRTKGQKAADDFLTVSTDEAVVGQPGGQVFRKSDILGVGSPGVVSGFGGGTFGLDGKQVTSTQGGGDPASWGGGYMLPVKGGTFGEGVGASRDGGSRKHNGLDIRAPSGSPVTSVAPGKVVEVGSDPKSGTFVRVRHPDGSTSSYSHLGGTSVVVGDSVDPSRALGTVGRTGNATGDVLHLVLRDAGGAIIDPRPKLSAGPIRVRSVQEARKLPSGTEFITPDGRTMRKP